MSAPTASAPTSPAPVVSTPIVAAPVVAAPIVSTPTMSGRWENGLCSDVCGGDCETCCAAWCCESFLYGRVAQRLDFFPHNNPAEIQTFDKHCLIYGCTRGLYMCWLPMAFKREEIRERFGIQGHLFWDCLVSAFCNPCGLAQMDSEMKSRAAKEQMTKATGYQPQTQGMAYLPPNQQPQVQPQPSPQPQAQIQEKKSTQPAV